MPAARFLTTSVTVTELERDEYGIEQWRVDWRYNHSDKPRSMVYPSKVAAQKLVTNLLNQLAPGLTRDKVLTINLKD